MPTKKPGLVKATPPQPSNPVQSPLVSADQFHQHLKAQARSAMRALLESTMREELDALLGVDWGEHSPQRKGYRNGYYQRDLGTTTGVISDLKVPRDRAGEFQTQVFENSGTR